MNANTEGDDTWNNANEEYEAFEDDLLDLEGELEDIEELLEGLEQDQLWDDAAAAYDYYDYA